MSDKSGSKVAKATHRMSEKAPQQTAAAVSGRLRVTEENATEDQISPDQMAEQYPTAFLQENDPRDAKYQLIEELRPDKSKPDTPYGRVSWSDEILDWIQKKQQATHKAKFQQWFAETFDKMSPTAKALARDLYPQFYAERQKTLKMNVKLLEQLASIRLNGVRSKSDLYLQYAADQGLIDQTGIKNILHPEALDNQQRSAQFKRGLFNPRRYFLGEAGIQGHELNSWDFHGRHHGFPEPSENHSGLLSQIPRQPPDGTGETGYNIFQWARQ